MSHDVWLQLDFITTIVVLRFVSLWLVEIPDVLEGRT